MNETSPQTEKIAVPTTRFDIQQHVTNTIIKQLEAGTAPWLKPWAAGKGNAALPKNGVTGKHYRGVNILLLWNASHLWQYPSNDWASLKQWNSKKETIRPKQNGQMIIIAKKDTKVINGEIKNFTYLQYSKVFNRCQLASYVPDEHQPIEQPPLVEKIKFAEDFIENTFAEIHHRKGGACYSPKSDKIIIPPKDNFIDTNGRTARENYYSTLFKELTHWTGHQKRLNRLPKAKFGDHGYAEEELVGELGAAFLSTEFGITTPEKKDHASYIANWLKVLKDNKQLIISAASEASKAVGYMHDLQPLKLR